MNTTLEQLQALKLLGMLDAWREQQASPTYQDLAFDERLALLVEREHLRRQRLRQQRRLKQAQLPVADVSLESIDYATPRGLSQSRLLQLAQGQWLQASLQLLLVGPTGIGKTFLASVLAHHLCRLGHTVRYGKTHELLAELKRAKADGSFPKLRKQLLAFDLLIWDEWLRDPLSLPDARLVLDLIDDRYRRKSCLFVTQLPVESWHPQIQDATLADAILDRIVHDAIRVGLKGESMRKLTSPLKADTTNDIPLHSASLDTSSENRDAKD